MKDDDRPFCKHDPGITYEGCRLVCQLREHAEGDHLSFVPPGDPGAMEVVYWTAAGQIVRVNRLIKGVTLQGPRPAAVMPGYTGSTCDNCESLRMVRSGRCETCLDCGTTTGCG